MNTATEKQYSSREEIFNDPQMGTYDKSLALAEWDKTHPPEPSAREEILSRGLSAYEAGQLIAKLPPEQPALPRLLPGERGALAEARNKLETLAKEYVELIARQEQGRQALEQTSKEKRKLETSLDFADVPGIQKLIFVTARLDVTRNWLAGADDKIKAVENSANSILAAVNALFNRKFGMTKESGGRLWANVGMGGALPTRISACCTAIEIELNRK
jgi:hypothetical protein